MDAFQEILTESVGLAIAKAFAAAGNQLPVEGTVFMSVSDPDKPAAREIARHLNDMRFEIIATEGTAKYRPHVVDIIINGGINLIINTPVGRTSRVDDKAIRTEAVSHGVPCVTTMEGAAAAVDGIRALRDGILQVKSLQEYHRTGI